METQKIKQHFENMKLLLSANIALDKARKSNSTLVARRSLRGGRATTNNARHSSAAETVFEIEGLARQSAADLFGFVGLSFDVFSNYCMYNSVEPETTGSEWPNQCGYGGSCDDRLDCKIENCQILKIAAANQKAGPATNLQQAPYISGMPLDNCIKCRFVNGFPPDGDLCSHKFGGTICRELNKIK